MHRLKFALLAIILFYGTIAASQTKRAIVAQSDPKLYQLAYYNIAPTSRGSFADAWDISEGPTVHAVYVLSADSSKYCSFTYVSNDSARSSALGPLCGEWKITVWDEFYLRLKSY